MKILYDYQAFEMQKFGGISRYFFEILKGLNYSSSDEWSLPVKYTTNSYLTTLPGYEGLSGIPDPYKEFFRGKTFKGKARLYAIKNNFSPAPDLSKYNQSLSVSEIQKGAFDLFHPTYYDNYFLPFIKKKPYVITVYDMIHEMYPEYFLKDETLLNKRKILENASMIISISHNTKKDLIRFFGIPEDRIEVIYLANSLNQGNDQKLVDIDNLPEKYLLFVGNRVIYKNFYFFLQSILPVLQQDSSIHIVCTGLEFDEDEIRYFKHLNLYERMHQYYVDDRTLCTLYKKAQAFVFPSLYEGFGLPVLEAFSCGCPVLVSNSSSLPEVAGDAALYFDPKDPLSINDALIKILYDPQLRKELVSKGFKQLSLFSWNKMYQETMQVYNKVLSNV